MDKSLKISVIVPVYNAEKYLDKCIQSILAQTCTDFELLLVNDGSKDHSGDICEKYAQQDSRIKVFHKENGGPGSARNVGLEQAKGEFVMFVDSDDFVLSDYLLHFAASVKTNPADLVIGGLHYCQNGEIKKSLAFEEHFYLRDEFPCLFSRHEMYRYGCPFSKLYRFELIQKNHLRFNNDVYLGEDTIFLYDFICVADSVSLISSADYMYECNQGSLTHRTNSFMCEYNGHVAYKQSLDEMLTVMKADDFLKHKLYSTFGDSLDRLLNAVYHNNMSRKERIKCLKTVDLKLYKTYKKSHTYKESILQWILLHNIYLMVIRIIS
jgi:glycosyltransferase involved in cell wall biosynthesis